MRSSRTSSTCSPAAIRRTSSRSSGRGSSGIAPAARCAGEPARGGSRSRTRGRSPTAASSASSSPTAAGASASSTRRWCTRRARGRRSCSARRPGGSRRSRATACSSRPRPACPASRRSGRARVSAAPAELGEKIGKALARARALADDAAIERVEAGVRPRRARRAEPRHVPPRAGGATGVVPSDRTIVVERFRDEIGDWRVCVLSPFGGRVHAPWAMALRARLRDSLDLDVQSLWSDDGIALHFPDADVPPPLADLLLEPDEIEDLLLGELAQSGAVRGAVPRERGPGAAHPAAPPGPAHAALAAAAEGAEPPAGRAALPAVPDRARDVREVLQDVFDLPALRGILHGIQTRALAVAEVETASASPFASSLLFDYVATYMYEDDTPPEERRAQALSLDRDLLRELMGIEELRELLDLGAIEQVEASLALVAAERRRAARPPAPRRPAPRRRVRPRVRGDAPARAARDSRAARRRRAARSRSRTPGSCATRSASCRRAACRRSSSSRSSRRCVRCSGATRRRTARSRPPRSPRGSARRREPSSRRARGARARGRARSRGAPSGRVGARVVRSRRPAPHPARDARRAAARGRAGRAGGVRALPPRLARDRAAQGLREALVPLQGLALPATLWESDVLPRRVPSFRPADLDVLCASGEVVWVGAGLDRVAVYFRDDAPLLGPPAADATPGGRRAAAIRAALATRALFWADLVDATGLAGRGRSRGALGARLGRRGDERLLGAAARVAPLRAAATRPCGPPVRADAPDDRVADAGALVARLGALRGDDRSARARRAPARAAGDRDPRRRARRGDPRWLRRRVRGAEGARDARRLPARVLRRGSRRRAVRAARRGRAAARAPLGAAARSPRRSCSPRPIRRSPTARRCRGRGARALGRRASPAPGSCCSTARRRSSSSAAAARSSRCASRIPSGSAGARGARRARAGGRREAARGRALRRGRRRRDRGHAAARRGRLPRRARAAPFCVPNGRRGGARRVPGERGSCALPISIPLLRGFVLGSFVVLGRELEEGAELPFAFEEHVERRGPSLYELRPLVRAFIEEREPVLRAREDARLAVEELRREPAAAIFARAHAGSRERGRGALPHRPARAPDRDRRGVRRLRLGRRGLRDGLRELEDSLFGERRKYVAIAPLIGHLAREAGRARARPRRATVRHGRARDALARVPRPAAARLRARARSLDRRRAPRELDAGERLPTRPARSPTPSAHCGSRRWQRSPPGR